MVGGGVTGYGCVCINILKRFCFISFCFGFFGFASFVLVG